MARNGGFKAWYGFGLTSDKHMSFLVSGGTLFPAGSRSLEQGS